MSISMVPQHRYYWDADPFIGNDGIRSTITRERFMELLNNLHFADNSKDDKIDKGYKLRTMIDHLNDAFHAAMSDSTAQSIHDYMTKFRVTLLLLNIFPIP